jgi:parallel beta-helix repeat protein
LTNKLQITLVLMLCLLYPATGFAVEDVTAHGALGDGTSDDTAAIQKAINALPAAGGSVYFPAGIYIASTVTIAPDHSILFYGEGANVSVVKHKAKTAKSMFANKAGIAGDVQFRDLGFDGNNAEQNTWEASAIELNCFRFAVESCAFVGTLHAAINLDGVTEVARITNSSFTKMSPHGGKGGWDTTAILVNTRSNYPGDVLISGNYFHADPPPEPGRGPGGVLVNPGTSRNTRVVIRDNIFDGIGQNHSYNYQACIQLYRNTGESIISGNKFYNSEYRSILVQRSNNVIVADNVFQGERGAKAVGAISLTGRNDGGNIDQYRIIVARNIIHNMPSCDGIFLNFDAKAEGNDIQVIDNVMENVRGGVILSHVEGGTSITGNNIRNVRGDDAIRGVFTRGWVHIAGNNIADVAARAVAFSDGTSPAVEVVVSENSFEAIAADAVDLRNIKSAIVTNNIFRRTPGSKGEKVLTLEKVNYAQVHGNIAPHMATTSIAAVNTFQQYGNSWDSSFRESLSAKKTWDPDNMAKGAITSTTITVPGAAVGDPAIASYDQIGSSSILISANVQSPNTVAVILLNMTGSPHNIPTGTLQVTVLKITPPTTTSSP